MKNNKFVKILIKYAACIVPATIMTLLVIDTHELALAESEVERYRILTDAFTIPGVVLIMVAALVFISNLGGFDGLGYSLKVAIKRLLPFFGAVPDEKYGDYVERKRAHRIKGYQFILHSGLLFLAIALYFMYKFYQIY
ncbi:MAG: DUF3899 domain-containing protein [Oscillospiraceae bacterium]|nr:DUF3899 domain-containing protein [Oscillospiraceae bacterium]